MMISQPRIQLDTSQASLAVFAAAYSMMVIQIKLTPAQALSYAEGVTKDFMHEVQRDAEKFFNAPPPSFIETMLENLEGFKFELKVLGEQEAKNATDR